MTHPSRLLLLCAAVSACAPHGSSAISEVTSAECAAAAPWQAWKAYATGTVITYGGTHYRCVQGHTSQPDWTPDVVRALWEPVGCDGGGGGGGGGGMPDAPPPPPPDAPDNGGGGGGGGGG